MRRLSNHYKSQSHLLLKSLPRCKKLRQRSQLTKTSRKQKLDFKRERLKMKLQLRRKEENSITSKLSASLSKLQVKLKLRLRHWLFNLKSKVKLKSKSQNSRLKLEESLSSLSSSMRRRRPHQILIDQINSNKLISRKLKYLEKSNQTSLRNTLIASVDKLQSNFQRLVQSFKLRFLTVLALRVT